MLKNSRYLTVFCFFRTLYRSEVYSVEAINIAAGAQPQPAAGGVTDCTELNIAVVGGWVEAYQGRLCGGESTNKGEDEYMYESDQDGYIVRTASTDT